MTYIKPRSELIENDSKPHRLSVGERTAADDLLTLVMPHNAVTIANAS